MELHDGPRTLLEELRLGRLELVADVARDSVMFSLLPAELVGP